MLEKFLKKRNKAPLFIYPHGLGDCLMLTPAIRQHYLQYGKKSNVIILERFRSSEIFCNNPYIDNIYFCKDPWHDFDNKKDGFKAIKNEGYQLAKEKDLKPIFIKHKSNTHKVQINCQAAKVKTSYKIDIFSSLNDVIRAKSLVKKLVSGKPFGFIQSTTGAGQDKDLPHGFGKNWLKEHFNLHHFIEVGESFTYDDFNINIQFEIMRLAKAVCLPDSVFYHACSGLNKNVDFAFFGRGENVYKRVKVENDRINENVCYDLKDA